MNSGEEGYRWPFYTAQKPLTSRTFDPETEQASTVCVGSAAKASNTDPLDLATLNDRIDPDCTDQVFDRVSAGPPNGVRVALEVSWQENTVLLLDDGHVEVYPTEQNPDLNNLSAAVNHSWSDSAPLHWSIGQAVANSSDQTATQVIESLIEKIDADSINRLLRPRPNNVTRSNSRLFISINGYEVVIHPDGSIIVEPSLTGLKRSGGTLLVVGSVPEQELDRAASTLLGQPGATRSPTFVLHGQDIDTVRRRLSLAGFSPSEGTVIEHQTTARSASKADTGTPQFSGTDLDIVTISGELTSLCEAVRETVASHQPDSPDQLRVSVDSVRSILRSSSIRTAYDALEQMVQTVREKQGIGHFLFPVDADRDEVETFAPLFDAVVELRMNNVNLEQRWTLTGTGHRTTWFPIGQ